MKYAYTTIIDRAWKHGVWLAGFKKFLTEQEAKQDEFIVAWVPKRIVLKNDETITEWLEAHKIHPSLWDSIK